MLLPRSRRWWTTRNCEILGSPDTLRVILSHLTWNPRFKAFLTLLYCRGSCKLSRISWTIWLPFHLLHNICFSLLLQRYDLVWIRKAQVSGLDYIARLSLQFSNHTLSKTIHNMSAHYLPLYYHPQWVPWIVLFTPPTSTNYQNIGKYSTHPRIIKWS